MRRKKITDLQKDKIKELLNFYTPKEICEKYQKTKNPISLSEIYKIRRDKQGRKLKELSLTERTDLVSFIHDWRKRAKFISLGELLELYWFGSLNEKLLRLATEGEYARKLFDTIQEHHAQSLAGPIRVILESENDNEFIELKQIFPTHPVWTLQDQWEKQYGEYIGSLLDWCHPIRRSLVHAIPSNANFSKEQSEASVEINLALVGLVVSCDFLLREIEEKPPSTIWYLETENIRQVRANTIIQSGTSMKNFISTDYDIDFVWNKELLIPGTGDLLDKLATLGTTSNNLLAALAELESYITSSLVSSP